MTLAEFKAWFEGFTEGMEAAPTAKQWKRIKERVAAIDGHAITREVVYRDRYWPTLINGPVAPYVSWQAVGTGNGAISNAIGMSNITSAASDLVELGRAEYSSVLAS